MIVTVEEKALHAGAVRLLRHETRGYALLETVDEAVGVLGKGAEALLKRQIELAVVVRHSREEFGVIGYEIDYRAAEIDRVKDDGGIIRYHQAVFILPCGAVGADAVVRDIQQAVVASEYRMILEIEVKVVLHEQVMQPLGVEERRHLLAKRRIEERLRLLLALVIDKRAYQVAAP